MNMRHYVHKVDEARRGLIIRLGLPTACIVGTPSTVRCKDLHIKYQGEALAGNALRVESAILELGETTARLCHMMRHSDGRIAASVIETVEHVYLPENKLFPWPKRVKAMAPHFTAEMPDSANARNIDVQTPHRGMSLSELQDAGVETIGAGVFSASELDLTNRVTMGSFMGRVTSSISWFSDGWPEFFDPAYKASGKSGALLELRAVIHNYPRQGDAYDFAPALVDANPYTRTIIHNLVNPLTGLSWASMQASACKFDLKERKLIKTTPEEIATLKKAAVKGIVA